MEKEKDEIIETETPVEETVNEDVPAAEEIVEGIKAEAAEEVPAEAASNEATDTASADERPERSDRPERTERADRSQTRPQQRGGNRKRRKVCYFCC